MSSYEYKVGGSLGFDSPSYVVRQADIDLYKALLNGELCYVFNARQMGKSSLALRTRQKLQQAGMHCAKLDMTHIGSKNITPQEWYVGIIVDLLRSFGLSRTFDLDRWLDQYNHVSMLQCLSFFIEELLQEQFPDEHLFIFIDETDSLFSLPFPTDDFFAFIRYSYNQRAEKPVFNRLTWALFGVATPSDLIRDPENLFETRTRTPFNIGRTIELHGFTEQEAQPLAAGLQGSVKYPQLVLQAILHWTGGQPFLTQKLCRLVVEQEGNEVSEYGKYNVASSAYHLVEQIVQSKIIDNWEAQDQPEHLRTIRDRLIQNEQRAGRLLGLYQQILQLGQVAVDGSSDQIELLLTGVVERRAGQLQIKNPIYSAVFGLDWVEEQLAKLRPYAEAFTGWLNSGFVDESRLLRGQALIDARFWAKGKSLSNLDYQFLAASQEFERQEIQKTLEAERAKEVEARLAEETKRLAYERKSARQQRFLLGWLAIALAIAIGLALTTYYQYNLALVNARHATINEIQAIAASSQALFVSNRKLDALITAIQAKRNLQGIQNIDSNTSDQVETVLQQAVYGAVEKNQLVGGQEAALSVAFSPDGQLVAGGYGDRKIRLWKKDGSLFHVLEGHRDLVASVAFSPQGNVIASASWDSTVKLWRTDGTLLRTLKGHSASVWAVTFSPDGTMIASAGADDTVKLWKLDGTLLQTFSGHSAPIWGISFSPEGTTLVSGSNDQTIKLWKIDGTLLRTLNGHRGPVWDVAFSPDGKLIASASQDATINLWMTDGTLVATLQGHTAAVRKVSFNSDGKIIASASFDNTIRLWNTDGTLLTTLGGHANAVVGISFSPDNHYLASASQDKTIRLWNLQHDLLIKLYGHRAGVAAVAFNPQGTLLASAGLDNTVNIWKPDGTRLRTLRGHTNILLDVAFSSDGATIASASFDKTIRLWSAADGTLLRTLTGHQSEVVSVVFSPTDAIIASAGNDATIRIWSINGTLLRTLRGHGAGLKAIAFSPNGELLASASTDNTIKLWRVKDGALLHTLTGHATTVTDVKFSPDGQFLASASWDNTIKIWNLDGTIWRTLNETSRVTRIAFNPDGKLIASVNDSSAINLWHLDGILLKSLRGHSTTVRDIAFSPNGQQIASASDDQSVILWNLSRILPMDLLTYGCSWIQDYLRTHLEVKESMPPDSNVLKSILPNVYTSRRLCNNLSAPFTDRQ